MLLGNKFLHSKPITKYFNTFNKSHISTFVGRHTSVGIATRYGLDGPALESLQGRVFAHTSRPTLWPTPPRVQWVSHLFPNGKATGAWRRPHTIRRRRG